MNKQKSAIPLISIVGRPNVGKSTLFNRIVGRRISIVDDMPGVTRDRIFARCDIAGRHCHIVDTGGLSFDSGGTAIGEGVEKQIMMSIAGSDVLVFTVDNQTGLTPEDRFVAEVVRRSGNPVVIAANKADDQKHDNAAVEFHELALGDPIPVSAHHGRNTAELIERIKELLPPGSEAYEKEPAVKFCIVGRPNVGKSSLTNAILGHERCVVSPVPGTTRDRVDVEFDHGGRRFVVIDTAGMRRKKTKMDSIEYYSFNRARRAVEESDVSILVLDAQDGLLESDKKIAGFIQKSRKGMLIAVNKMDLIEGPNYRNFLARILQVAPFLRNMPILFVSALNSTGINEVLQTTEDVHRRLCDQLPVELLKNVIFDTRMLYSPHSKGRRTGEIFKVVHDKANPPRVVIKVNDPELFPPDYVRLIENRIRSVFNLSGVPLDLIFSEVEKKKKK